jgi:exodeoxyribonuclease VII small subunit
MTSTQISYSEAMTELEQIVRNIEVGEIEVDALAQEVSRAATLINLLRTKLRTTDEAVKTALSEMADDAPLQAAKPRDRTSAALEPAEDLGDRITLITGANPLHSEYRSRPITTPDLEDPFADE